MFSLKLKITTQMSFEKQKQLYDIYKMRPIS